MLGVMTSSTPPSSPVWSAYDGVDEAELAVDEIYKDEENQDKGGPQASSKPLRQFASKVSVISRGTQSVVYSAYLRREPGVLVAIKRIFSNDGNCYAPQNMLVCRDREIEFLRLFDEKRQQFPHMIRLIDVLDAPSRESCVVVEHCPFELSNVVIHASKRSRNGSTVVWPEKIQGNLLKYLLHNVLVCVRELHDAGIAHRDIKLSNFLFLPSGEIRLADFGSSRWVSETLHPSPRPGFATPAALRTTLLYRSPEALLGSIPMSHLFAQDMWSVGVIFAEMIRGKHLFSCHGELALIGQVFSLVGTPTPETWPGFSDTPAYQSFEFRATPSILKEKFEHHIDAEGLRLLIGLLNVCPERRLSVDEALQHPYFSDLRASSTCVEDGGSEAESVSVQWATLIREALAKVHAASNAPRIPATQQLLQRLLFGGGDDEEDSDDDDQHGDDEDEDPFGAY